MKTHISFLLDETGSMDSIKGDTIGGFNTFLRDQQRVAQDGHIVQMSFVTFNSARTRTRYKRTAVQDVAELTDATYRPQSTTPLIDACVDIIRSTQHAVSETNPDQVLVVIQTDGHENSSAEHSASELKRLVDEKQELRWEFLFLGAGLDAFTAASNIGLGAIGREKVLSYSRARSADAFAAVSANASQYARGTRRLRFSEAHREAAGDAFYDPGPSLESTEDEAKDSAEDGINV